MILLGIGGNLASAEFGAPPRSLEAALELLREEEIEVLRRSRWYRSAPVPPSAQPWYLNGVALIATTRDPASLLEALHRVEARFGRERRERNAARSLDLDLLAYGSVVTAANAPPPALPHPRLHERAFVLRPLAELAPEWRHPRLGLTAAELLARLPPGQKIERFEGDGENA